MEKQRENGADMEREEEALTRSLVRETLAEPAKTARLWRLARELRRAMRTLRRAIAGGTMRQNSGGRMARRQLPPPAA